MKSFTKTYFTVMQIIDLILGILFCITIVGLIFGIPLCIASGKFKKANLANNEELISMRGSLMGWGIFSAIILAPTILGFFVLIVLVVLANNQILALEKGETEKANRTFGQAVSDGAKNAGNTIKNGAKATVDGTKEVFGIQNKMDKQNEELARAKKWKDDGIISEEEYNSLKRKILGIN